jgi:hypothetical protein
MKKEIPDFLANQKKVSYNFLDDDNSLIIGDTEKVLDIKNQFIIETSNAYNSEALDNHKDLAVASIVGDNSEYFFPIQCYPLIGIKKGGSGLNDIFKKNNHLPSAFICVHEYTKIDRRTFDISTNYKIYTSKETFVKSIQISSNSISFLPRSNNLNCPFYKAETFDNSQKFIEDFSKEEIKDFQKKLNLIKKQKNKKQGRGDIIKYDVENGIYNIYNPSIRADDIEGYEGNMYPYYDKFIFVMRQG